MLPITAVVCTLNSINSIDKCLKALQDSQIGEIVVVDGGSTDGTLDIVSKYNCALVFDQGNGLAAARNLGISHATKHFILNCGADNVMNEKLLRKMLETIQSNKNIAGVGCRTRVLNSGILSKMLNIQWKGRIVAGTEDVLGTPNIFERETLNTFKYSEERTWSDDEDLSTRIRSNSNKKMEVIDDFCLEIGQDNLTQLKYRFKCYGKSDFEIYKKYSNNWSFRRKLKSISHPVEAEFLNIFKNVSIKDFLFASPLLIFSTVYRYFGWIKEFSK